MSTNEARVGRSSILLGVIAPSPPLRATRSSILVGSLALVPPVRATRSTILFGFTPTVVFRPTPASVVLTAPPGQGTGPGTILMPSAVGVIFLPQRVRLGTGRLLNAEPVAVDLVAGSVSGPIVLTPGRDGFTLAPLGPVSVVFSDGPPVEFPCDLDAQPVIAEGMRGLLPWGLAWARQEGSRLSQLLMGLAVELACLRSRALDLLAEADPRTTREMLPDWERNMGLPDPCGGGAGSVPDRRRDVVARFTESGPPTPAYLIAFAAGLGFPITIEELDTFRAGWSRAGERFDNIGRRFTAGYSRTGQRLDNNVDNQFTFIVHAGPLAPPDRERLECAMARIIPAHTRAAFQYLHVLQPVPTRVSLHPTTATRG